MYFSIKVKFLIIFSLGHHHIEIGPQMLLPAIHTQQFIIDMLDLILLVILNLFKYFLCARGQGKSIQLRAFLLHSVPDKPFLL